MNLTLNSTLIITPFDFKKSFITPALIPRIYSKPIRSFILNSPSYNFDSMSSQFLSRCKTINSWSVSKKIFIYSKRCLNRSMSHYLSLNFFYCWWNTINRISKPSIGLIWLTVYTMLNTLRSWLSRAARTVSTSCVMVTWRKRIR